MTQKQELQEKIEEITQDLLIDPCEPVQIKVTNELFALFLSEWEKLIGDNDEENITNVSNQLKPYLREKQLYRNQLRQELRTTLNQLEAEKKGKYL